MLFSGMHQKPLKISRKLATIGILEDLHVVDHIFNTQQADLPSICIYANHMNFY